MRRAAAVIASTAGGLALLAGFHTSPAGTSQATADSTVPSTAPPATTTAGSQTRPAATTTAPPARTIDGPVIATKYGDVQVRVTLQGSTITDVQALQLPSDRSRSQRISQQAGPILRNEALQAQSAKVHAVSGATYTTDGYTRSLQGALDKAGR